VTILNEVIRRKTILTFWTATFLASGQGHSKSNRLVPPWLMSMQPLHTISC